MTRTPAPRDATGATEALLEAVASVAQDFLLGEEWGETVARALGQLGRATRVHRVYVFRKHRALDGTLLASQLHEWVADGVEPQIDNPELQDVPFEDAGFDRWARVLSAGEIVAGPVDSFPEAERELLEAQQVKSLVVTPVFVNKEWWGFIGFDDTARMRGWSRGELEALRTAAGTFGHAYGRRLMEAELRQREAELREAQKMEAIGRLAAGVAHDFNNLLTGLRGAALLALEEAANDDPVRYHLVDVLEAADRGADLTAQLMAFSRRDGGDRVTQDLNAAILEIERLLVRLLGQDVRLEIRLTAGPLWVRAGRGELGQVLMNLAVNARDAMPAGGELRIDTEEDGPGLLLRVTDTGTGMDEHTRARVFEPFFTTKAEGQGTGLGLSGAYGIVKKAGGDIAIESEPGQGTAFEIRLPRAEPPVDAGVGVEAGAPVEATTAAATGAPLAAAPSGTARAREAGGTRGGAAILMVEDDGGVRRLGRKVLERAGYHVHTAATADEALAILQDDRRPVHLLLTDLGLPGVGGLELSERCRELRPDASVLLVSGGEPPGAALQGNRGRVSAFLAKPFSPGELLEAVERALLRHRR